MTADNPSDLPAAALCTPLHVGAVAMTVRDLGLLADYYVRLLGLTVMERTPRSARLGVDGVTLLELEQAPGALPDDPREAGLYHTAFLMPTRTDLARWILDAANRRIPITGASDHDVSEAIYLDDPEGNGVEVYSDRPSERWRREGNLIFQKTEPLDIEAIIREVDPATATYPAAPKGLRVGHMHLRVGDIAEAERFYVGTLGLDVTRRRTGATFVASGGYHHHVAFNVWQSQGATARNPQRAGLAAFELQTADAAVHDRVRQRLCDAGHQIETMSGAFAATDPWGNRIRFTLSR